jgi:hypothetical protein
MEIAYQSHRENDDGTSLVGFRIGNKIKYRVLKSRAGYILDWIREEKIIEYLTSKYLYDLEFDRVNNIKRFQSVLLKRMIFKFDSFDGCIEIYHASVYNQSQNACSILESLDYLFDLSNDKFVNMFSDAVKELGIEFKTMKIVKERYDVVEQVEINGSWEEFIREKKLVELGIG